MTDSAEHPPDEAGVLSNLGGTRPQRRSSKRPPASPSRRAAEAATSVGPPGAASASDAAPTATPKAAGTRRARATSGPAKKARRPPPAPKPDDDPPADRPRSGPTVAAQGFEAEPVHGAVEPPTGAELLASVAQGATELAEIGVTLGRKLVRSVIDRLPRL